MSSALLFATAAGATAQLVLQEQPFDLERADVRLIGDRTAYPAGDIARLATVLDIEAGWHTNSNTPTLEYLIATEVELHSPAGWSVAADPAYPPGEMQTFSFAEFPISVYDGQVVILSEVAVPAGAAEGTYPVRAEVTYQACDDKMCLAPVTTETTFGVTVGPEGVEAEPGLFAVGPTAGAGRAGTGASGVSGEPGGGQAGAAGAQGATGAGSGGRGFLGFILLGLLGGLILNAMPCVLPVLSLKVFGLVKSAEGGRGAIVSGSLATALGILLSFWILAGAAVAARSAGAAVGWGIQFQNPGFVAALAVVVTLFTLNLWGVFEIRLPMGLARVGSSGPDEGLAGHLTTGFFATLMATPCSAPFLGTALGFALTQSAATTFAMFSAIGVGMASPYLLLAAVPAAGRILPKPGAWMVTFRVVMGFLLAATTVWLLYVLSSLVSAERLAFFEIALLAIAAVIWLGGRDTDRTLRRRVALAAAVLLCVGSVAYAARGVGDPPTSLGVAPENRLISWETWSPARVEAAVAAGQPVFVDVTADWCFTCKVNEGLFLETEDVAGAFERHDVLALRADWTRPDDEIADMLASFNRYGIPFYVMYRPGREPYVLSELLSRSAIVDLLGE